MREGGSKITLEGQGAAKERLNKVYARRGFVEGSGLEEPSEAEGEGGQGGGGGGGALNKRLSLPSVSVADVKAAS